MPQTYLEEYTALAGFFETAWNGETGISFDNEPFTPKVGTPWIRFTIRNGESSLASIGAPGNNFARYRGIVFVQVFTPLARGSTLNRTLADKVIEIFEGAGLDGFEIGLPSLTPTGNSIKDGWYQINISIPFTRISYK